MDGKSVLEVRMPENDAGATTIKEYLIALLRAVWSEGESFSGKRPFGNSGWEYELYHALARGGAIDAKIEGDEVISFDQNRANYLIDQAIHAL